MMKKSINFPKNLFFRKIFVWTCTKKFWQDCCNVVAKNAKKFPIVQKNAVTFFWSEFVFIKIDSLATEHAILTTIANNFLLQSTDWQLRFRKPRKKHWTFRKENNFPENVPMYMYNAVVTTLPKFCRQNSEKILLDFRKWGKINKHFKEIICKNLRLNIYNEVLTSLP